MNLILISGISNTKLAIIVLAVIAILAFLISIYLLLKVLYLSRLLESHSYHRSASGKYVAPFSLGDALRNSRSAQKYIKELVEVEVKRLLSNPSAEIIEALSDKVYDDVRHLLELNCKESVVSQSISEQQTRQDESWQSMPMSPTRENDIVVYYASALDEDNKTFYAVTDYPIDGETVFKFYELRKGKCEFVVYEKAYSKVLTDDNFLTGACNLSKLGNSRVVVEKNGVAELTPDNKWIVVKPAIVKFE